jgi:hypothetical protein
VRVFPRPLPIFSLHSKKKKKEIEKHKVLENGRFKMNGFFRRNERLAYFKLTKLKLFGNERRGMKKKIVK